MSNLVNSIGPFKAYQEYETCQWTWWEKTSSVLAVYSESSFNGTLLMQSLMSYLHKNPTYTLHFDWYCEFRFYQDRPIYIRIPCIYCPTYRVLTVVVVFDFCQQVYERQEYQISDEQWCRMYDSGAICWTGMSIWAYLYPLRNVSGFAQWPSFLYSILIEVF